MGEAKVIRRKSLLRQILISYLLIMICSMVTAAFLITAFYLTFHSMNDEKKLDLNNEKITRIIKFINRYGSSIDDDNIRNQLDVLLRSSDFEYYVKDENNNILYETGITENNSRKKNAFLSRITDLRRNIHNTSNIQIPVIDKKTGQIRYMFVITYYSTITWVILSCVDAGIPFVCFLVYTFIFAGRFSKKIRTPLQELMHAVEKIKDRDLDFSMKCTSQNNEIGDLVQALEEMRSELKNSLMKQWQLEQDRRDMVSSITHDIRTPVAIIQGHVEGLQEGKKNNPEKLNTYLDIIERNIKRTKKLIDDMNTLVEIDNDGFSMHSSPIDLHEFMENKTSEIKILANKKGILLEIEVIDYRKENIPVCLDIDRLSQIIDNIVSNSIRFTPEGGNIRIFTEIKQDEAVFRISDTGEGFSEKDFTNLFKKFYKGDYSRSIEKGHSGLGLYIAKSIIERHGGTIKAFNLEEGGACIEFSIKIK